MTDINITGNTTKQNATFKLLLMGDSGTGKSSLLMRFIEDKFLGENMQDATIGVDFKVKTIDILDGQKIKLTIWVRTAWHSSNLLPHVVITFRTQLVKRDLEH